MGVDAHGEVYGGSFHATDLLAEEEGHVVGVDLGGENRTFWFEMKISGRSRSRCGSVNEETRKQKQETRRKRKKSLEQECKEETRREERR